MFEQSLYEFESVAAPVMDVELFNNYEIKTWDNWSRIYKIIGVSALANILVLLIVAQTSLLTMKGCDSPLVGRVCDVLDTVYVGSMLFGTDREYVDAAYDKTDLADSDITFVDVTGVTPPLAYPEGYFQVANPVEYQAKVDQLNNPGFPNDFSGLPPGFPITTPSTGSSLIDTPPLMPKANPNVLDGPLPNFGDSSAYRKMPTIPRQKINRGGRINSGLPDIDDLAINKTPSPSPTPTPLAAPMTSDAVTALEINKKPLTDFTDDVAAKLDAKDVDLNLPFTIVLNGVLTKDGKLDRDKSKFDVSKQKGDQKMIDVAKSAIEAVGDSGFLAYLKSLNVDKVTLTMIQDDNQITAVISSAQKTPEIANTVSTGLRNYISFGKIAVKNPSDERTLLDAATVTADDKNFVLNFAIPKPVAQEMITRKLKEAQAKKAQQPKPNGNAITKPVDNTAKK